MASEFWNRFRQVGACELRTKYTIISTGAEDMDILEEYGIVSGSIHTILCIQVLYCATNPDEVAKVMHQLLKPENDSSFGNIIGIAIL